MRAIWNRLSHNWQLKLSALGIATVLWLGVQSGRPYRYRMDHVPVRVANHDAEWVVAAQPSPAFVSVELEGLYRDLLRLGTLRPRVVIPVDDVSDTAAIFALKRAWLDYAVPTNARGVTNITVVRMQPDTIRVSFDRLATRLVSLHARFSGAIADGYELAGPPIIDPAVVRATGAARLLARLDSIELPAIDVSSMRGDDTVTLDLDTTAIGATITPHRARIIVPIRRKVSMTEQTPVIR
jgi:YbbR domain-containing protein